MRSMETQNVQEKNSEKKLPSHDIALLRDELHFFEHRVSFEHLATPYTSFGFHGFPAGTTISLLFPYPELHTIPTRWVNLARTRLFARND